MSELPKVKLSVLANGRGSLEIDGVELEHVTAVSIQVRAYGLTTVTISFPASVEFYDDGATVKMRRGTAEEVIHEDDGA